jgi:DNA replication protein DnaC
VPSPGDGAARLGDILGRVQVVAAAPERAEVLQARLRELRARRREGLRATCNTLGVPEDEDMREVVLDDDAAATQALAAVRSALAWRGDARRGLVLVLGGERGLGKSAAMGWALARHEGSALWVDAADVGATPRNGYSDNAHAWERWLSVQLLALDDLGTEKGDPEDLVGLLAQRYNRGRATIVSTNLSRAQIAERYLSSDIGRRLADRLINAQGRAVRGDNGKLRLGDSGTPWYVALAGASLRSVEAREALQKAVLRG